MIKKLTIPTNSLFFTFLSIMTFSVLLTYSLFNKGDNLIQIMISLLLAEPHFFLTVPLLFLYRNLFLTKKLVFIFIPLFITIIMSFLFFYNFQFFSIIFLVANLFHVNRQSEGIVNLLFSSRKINKINNLWIYYLIFSIFFILPHLVITLKENYYYQATISFLVVLVFIYLINKEKSYSFLNLKEKLFIIKGFIIFWPALFIDNIMLAFAIGISVHYWQYIFLSTKIIVSNFNFSRNFFIIFCVISYCSFSTLALSGYFSENKYSIWILVPTLIQLLHFYYDSFIWRTSNLIIREKIIKSFS